MFFCASCFRKQLLCNSLKPWFFTPGYTPPTCVVVLFLFPIMISMEFFFYLSVTKICFKKLLPFFNFALFVSIKVFSQKPDTNYSTKTLENLTFWETAKHASSNNSSYIKIIFTLLVKIKILPQELYQLR